MRGDAVNPATSAEFAVVVGVLTYAAHRWHPELELGDLLLLAAGVCIAYFGLRLLLDRLVRGRPSPPKIVLEHQQLIGLRVAIERTTALPLLASLGQTQGAADVAAVAKALLAQRSSWRLVGLDATRPLERERAEALFERWRADVRDRFARTPGEGGGAFRQDALTLVALHVATSAELPSLELDDPRSAERLLTALRDGRGSAAMRFEVWSSPRGFSPAELRGLDPTLIETTRESSLPQRAAPTDAPLP